MRIRHALSCALFLAAWPSAGAIAADGRSVEIIIDASGSMKAELGPGTTRLDGAKAAVADIVARLPADTQLGFWAYGHQSDTGAKNCGDIEEIVPIGPASVSGPQGLARVQQLTARGYTPITTTITRAAGSLAASEAPAHVLVLVSDGKETCTGDPCAAARALAKADAKLVIHAIGLGVDDTTRTQLQCIAEMGRGRYFDAASASDLSAALGVAIAAPAAQEIAAPQVLTLKRPGRLQVVHPGGAGMYDRYVVRDSETGKDAGFITGDTAIELPASIYTVSFPSGDWTGVAIRNGETTKLAASVLRVLPKGDSHGVRDPETGVALTVLDWSRDSRGVVMPGRYDLEFCGGTLTVPVEAKAGSETVVTGAAIQISGGFDGVVLLNDAKGRKVCEFRDGFAQNRPYHVVPPGRYVLDYKGSTLDVEAVAGKTIDIKLQ